MGTVDELTAGVSVGTVLAESTMIARDLVNHPANVMTPTKMAEAAREVAESVGLELDVMDRDRMREHGMGAFLGVAQGSEEPPQLIVMTYRGDPDNPQNNLGLVGKGITFDTGGISLKPAANMEAMKGDMGRRRVGDRCDERHRFVEATDQRNRVGRCHREHARRTGAAPRRRGDRDERQDHRGHQHGR